MLTALPELERMPRTARRGVLFAYAGWCCFLYATYAFYDPASFFKFAIAAAIVCYFLYWGKPWARVLAMLSSIFIVAYSGFFAYLFASSNPLAAAFSLANMVFFALSLYFLALPETGRHFKRTAQAESPGDASPPDPPDRRS